MLFALAFICTFVHRRADRAVPRQRQRRHPAVGHLLRGRALPHGDGRGAAAGGVRRHLPLVSRRSPAACSTTGSASSTSGSPSSAPTLIYFPMHYLGVLGMPRRYYNFDDYEFIPPSAHHAQHLHHRGRADRRRGAAGVRLQPRLERLARPAGDRQPRGAPPRSNGRRPTRRRGTATGARSCRWSTAGPTPTACRARRRTSSRRTRRPEAGGVRAARPS